MLFKPCAEISETMFEKLLAAMFIATSIRQCKLAILRLAHTKRLFSRRPEYSPVLVDAKDWLQRLIWSSIVSVSFTWSYEQCTRGDWLHAGTACLIWSSIG